MIKMTDEEDNDKGFFDMLDTAVDMYEENKDTIKDVLGSEDNIGFTGDDYLKSVIKDDDCVIITVDVGDSGLEDIGLRLNGNTAEIDIGKDTVAVDVPVDVNMKSPEAQLNNGVLEVTLPREKGGK